MVVGYKWFIFVHMSYFAIVGASVKKCSRCNKLLPKTQFHRDRTHSDNLKSQCKSCRKQNSKPKDKYARAESTYNLPTQVYKEMENKQHSKCAICRKRRKLVVDHCHTNLHVRGLLCSNCNTAIGLLKENIFTILSTIPYLLSKTPLILKYFQFFEKKLSKNLVVRKKFRTFVSLKKLTELYG